MTQPTAATLSRLWLRMRTPCAVFPCKRCDKARRILTESREAWHTKRRRRALLIAAWIVTSVLAGFIGGWVR